MTALLATAPALPLHTAGKYVAGAYIVFVLMILIYVAIMAMRLGHTQRELSELKKDVEESERSDERDLEHVG
jgi:cell division protein FtsL